MAIPSLLFREIQETVLADLPVGWMLAINMGHIDPISAAFYRCLLDIRKCVNARGSHLVLCGLTPHHKKVFDLFRGPEVFTIVRTEARARRYYQRELSRPKSRRHQLSPRGSHASPSDSDVLDLRCFF